jgi:hypothetical protein
LTLIQALQNGRNSKVRRSIFGTNPVSVETLCREQQGAKKGETPVVAMPGKRQSISAAYAVNAKGGFWFATYQGAISAELFMEMLKILMKGRRRSLFLILDSLPAHHKPESSARFGCRIPSTKPYGI